MPTPHNSRHPWYRDPMGALPVGHTVRLRLCIPDGMPSEPPVVRTWTGQETRLPMRALGAWQGAFRYEAEVRLPLEPVLFWYRFEWRDTEGRHVVYGNAEDGLGGEGSFKGGKSYQVTVYDPAFQPPDFLRRGVMYQIMVDRFCKADPTGRLIRARGDVQIHDDWEEIPTFVTEESGDNFAHDFFGGTLLGIQEKLPYLADLGVTVLYLNPIFQAASNHKYDVGDYHRVDPMFGDLEAFHSLCSEAKQHGIRILLDGVFSHVGDDSRYFNKYGRYPGLGAYQSKDSQFYPWFTFDEFPEEYQCWWGFLTLPNVDEMNPSYQAFTLTGRDAVVPYWLRQGAAGWRLDVADELPMDFLRTLRMAAKMQDPNAVVLGEVWEDASNKVAYDVQRSYVLGDTLDSVMNYPLREALIGWVRGELTGEAVLRRLRSLQENYPKPFFYATMNLMGSHDRARILNVLAEREFEEIPRPLQGQQKLSPEEYALGQRRLYLLLRLLLALPGIPCIYYGDEAGLQGAADPFCRGTYPWGREDEAQLQAFRALIGLRRAHPVLQTGDLAWHMPQQDTLCVRREISGGQDVFGEVQDDALVILLANRGMAEVWIDLPARSVGGGLLRNEAGDTFEPQGESYHIPVQACGATFLFRIRI